MTGASDEPFALVDLGRCQVRVAERLASVVRGEWPAVGTAAVDQRDGRVGEAMGHVGCVRLRPVVGGREWDCPEGAVAVAPSEEVMRARLRGTNKESAGTSGAGQTPPMPPIGSMSTRTGVPQTRSTS